MLKNNLGEVIELKYGANGNPVVPLDYDLVSQITRFAMETIVDIDPDDYKRTARALLERLPLEWGDMDEMVKGLFLVNYGATYFPKWDYNYAHQPARALFDSVHGHITETIGDEKDTPRGKAVWRTLLDLIDTHMEYRKEGLFDDVAHLIEGRRDEGRLPVWYWGGPTREAHFKKLRDIRIGSGGLA